VGVGICALIAWRVGEAKGFFLFGIYTSLIYGAAFLISILVRRPLVGVVWGVLNGHGGDWRADPRVVRLYDLATVAWVLVFGARYLVQNHLYDTDNTGWLAAAHRRRAGGDGLGGAPGRASARRLRTAFRRPGLTFAAPRHPKVRPASFEGWSRTHPLVSIPRAPFIGRSLTKTISPRGLANASRAAPDHPPRAGIRTSGAVPEPPDLRRTGRSRPGGGRR
jgi:hypothetical protein